MLLSHRLALKVRATVTLEGVPRQTVSPHPEPPRMCARGPWLPSSLLPPSASAFPGPQRTVLLCVLRPLPPGHPPSPDSAPDAADRRATCTAGPGRRGRAPSSAEPGHGGPGGPPRRTPARRRQAFTSHSTPFVPYEFSIEDIKPQGNCPTVKAKVSAPVLISRCRKFHGDVPRWGEREMMNGKADRKMAALLRCGVQTRRLAPRCHLGVREPFRRRLGHSGARPGNPKGPRVTQA